MTLPEVVSILTPVALAFRADVDGPTFRAYHRLLKDVPPGLLEAGVELLIDAGQRFFPTAVELQHAAEKARRAFVALQPYDGCAECEGQTGFRSVTLPSGAQAVEPCPCKARYQERLAQMGLRSSLATLPAEAGADDVVEFPTLEQLPSGLRAKLETLAAQKVLR